MIFEKIKLCMQKFQKHHVAFLVVHILNVQT